ncbi:hypothetical protein M407DRAFT_246420 [Tulasnella calospora MUT 4182]|uniref:Uncharacterized protein n=1 Tax=Tulasnella calospora MUT 4182 TaxID=1051891 RepID=A0A0C3KB75_9AGAM|nr:hypothetical protein M407DRAFT_246420 [Tulasnella calospora MUT 4182]
MHPELLESSGDPASLSGPPSTTKRWRESFASVPPLPPATFVTGVSSAVLNSLASSSSPLPPPALPASSSGRSTSHCNTPRSPLDGFKLTLT